MMGARRVHDRGSVYVAVLGVSMLVTVIGLGGALVTRIRIRQAVAAGDARQAQLDCLSGIELARLAMSSDPSWRSKLVSGAWSDEIRLASGSVRWRVTDPIDGNLSNDDTHPVRVQAQATTGGAIRGMSVELVPRAAPLELLSSSLHAGFSISVTSSQLAGMPVVLASDAGPLSTNGSLLNSGIIRGDVEYLSAGGTGTIRGASRAISQPKPMPSSAVFTDLLSASTPPTEIAWTLTNFPLDSSTGRRRLGADVLGPAVSSPLNIPLNSDGLYLVRVPAGVTLEINRARLRCSLLIDAGAGANVIVGGQIHWSPHRADYPTLLVRGATSVQLEAWGPGGLSETDLGKNFNPPGFAFDGASNSTQTDLFPAELRGVVYIMGAATITRLAPALATRGTIVCDGAVQFPVGTDATSAVMRADPSLRLNPPKGFAQVLMEPTPGSWQREPAVTIP